MTITDDIKYIGVTDKRIDLFEGQYRVPDGISYNSYVIIDEKIAVLDTVDTAFTEEWLENLRTAIGDRTPDYLIIQHMEPDHSANIMNFAKLFPSAKLVASAKAFNMAKNFFGTDFSESRMVVGEGETLSLGKHCLSFINAPMVHWPEVIMTYDSLDKVLFSADGFGKFGEPETDEPWADEARRYYIGIVGKYGAQVTSLLNKAKGLDIEKICPLHGPVLTDNLPYYLGLYTAWASYEPEQDGVMIACASVYGNTMSAAKQLKDKLASRGAEVRLYDLARCDMSEAVSNAFKFSKLVLASSTYNGDVFPPMREFISNLTERGYKNRTVALMENGSWAPMAAKVMRKSLEECKGLTFSDTTVTILSAVNKAAELNIDKLAGELYGEE